MTLVNHRNDFGVKDDALLSGDAESPTVVSVLSDSTDTTVGDSPSPDDKASSLTPKSLRGTSRKRTTGSPG